jgi:hypothetical protein
MPLSPRAQAALNDALSTRGPSKGRLKATAPKYGTDGYWAWHAAQLSVNPYKVSIFGAGMLSDHEQRSMQEEITRHFDAMPKKERIKFDADRAWLEGMGVW